jgi:hypothetical protein
MLVILVMFLQVMNKLCLLRWNKLQIVQELKPNDSVLRLQFCENLLAKIKEDANCEMDST